jgi:hypothetical protein
MNKLSYIRFGTYGVLLIALFLARDQPGMIAVDLPIAGIDDTELFSSPQWSGPASEFLGAKRSIAEVIQLASNEIDRRGVTSENPQTSISEVTLRKSRGKLLWSVVFYLPPEPGTYAVIIDDLNGGVFDRPRHTEPDRSP